MTMWRRTIHSSACHISRRIVTGSWSMAYALIVALTVSCGQDAPSPSNAVKVVVVPPRDTAGVKRQNTDSAFVVLHAVAALESIAPRQAYRLISYQRTDSGAVISLIP